MVIAVRLKAWIKNQNQQTHCFDPEFQKSVLYNTIRLPFGEVFHNYRHQPTYIVIHLISTIVAVLLCERYGGIICTAWVQQQKVTGFCESERSKYRIIFKASGLSFLKRLTG